MDLIATYPRRLALFALLSALLLVGLRAPIAYLNSWRAEQEVMSSRLPWAMSEFRRALFLTPNDPKLLVAVGYAYEKSGRRDEAVPYYRRAAELDPKGTEPLYLLALDLQRSGKLAEAISAMEESLRRNPDEDRAWRLLAMLYKKQGRTAEAVRAWREVAARFPAARTVAEANIRDLERTR